LADPSKLDALLRGIAGQAPESKYIRAYHGSPYDFDRFDASKIGTGEGAQAYGHGLYFAGNEAVADSYRRMNSLPEWTPEEFASNWWRTNSGIHAADAATAKAVTIRDIEEAMTNSLTPEFMQRGIEYLRNAGDAPPPPVRHGRMYEVEIARPEDSLLDWDATLDEQQRLLPAAERAIGRIQDPMARYDAMGIIEEPAANKGRDLYGILKAYAPESNLAGDHTSFASRALLEEGVPGLRYLDGNSRAAGQGTRNYVMFPGTEDSIRILRKYGIMAPIAASASSSGGQQ